MIYIFVLLLGVFIGVCVEWIILGLLVSTKCGGTIVVTENEEKLVYSLELNDDPEKLKSKKEITFNIVNATEESHRE